METAKVQPEHLKKLRALAGYRNRNSDEVAAIDAAANARVEELISGDYPHQVSKKAAGLISSMVGWSSKQIDQDSGQAHLASLNPTDKHDVMADGICHGFLLSNEHVTPRIPFVTETHVIESFQFMQFRRNRKTCEVVISRKEPIGHDVDGLPIEYCLSFNDLGEYSAAVEEKFDEARFLLETQQHMLGNVVGLTIEAVAATTNMAAKIGQQLVGTVLPDKPSSITEDFEA